MHCVQLLILYALAWLMQLGDVPGGGELGPAVIDCARALLTTTTAFSTTQKPVGTLPSSEQRNKLNSVGVEGYMAVVHMVPFSCTVQ